jgi:GNAT superfamily N-acetyltransferase
MEATKSVRVAQIEDANQIAACLSSLGYGTRSAFLRGRLKEIADSQSDMVFVCEFDDVVVGVISLHAMPLFHTDGRLVRITSLSVLEGWFRKGVGAQLIEAAERWAWSKGAVRVELTSGDHRNDAHKFYEAMGYLLAERRFIKRNILSET